MKTKSKIIVSIIFMVICLLVLPAVAIRAVPAEAAMGISFLLFFAVDPFLILVLGITAGTETRRLWWLPVSASIFFPIGFSIAILEPVWDLFIYAAIYLGVGLLAMLGTHVGRRLIGKK